CALAHLYQGEIWNVHASQLKVRLAPPACPVWRCVVCQRPHLHPAAGVCTTCQAALDGQPTAGLTCNDVARRHYYGLKAVDRERPFRLHCEELTGQTDDQALRQRLFRDLFLPGETVDGRTAIRHVDAIDVLSVTTTMEVGVDIGNLLAVYLANMPPER